MKGLGDVIVGTHVHALTHIRVVTFRRQKDERYGIGDRVGAQGSEQTMAVHDRHHHIRKHDVGQVLAREIDGLGTVFSNEYFVALDFEQADQVFSDRVVVLRNQYARRVR